MGRSRAGWLILSFAVRECSQGITHLKRNSRYLKARSIISQIIEDGHRVGWLCNTPEDSAVQTLAASPNVLVIPMPTDPAAYARSLYATLHAVDQRGLDRLIVDIVPSGPEWAAVRDRLKRAAT